MTKGKFTDTTGGGIYESSNLYTMGVPKKEAQKMQRRRDKYGSAFGNAKSKALQKKKS